MAMTVDLPDDVSRRLEDAARRRGVPVGVFVAELLDHELPSEPNTSVPLSFIGIAEARPDLGETYKQARRELASGRAAEA